MTDDPPTRPLVLSVDDDPAMRLLLAESLDQAGFEVLEADSAERALALLPQHQPDLVLMDVRMPGMDGFAACQAIHALPGCGHLPVVMVTALDDMASVEQAYRVGAADFITKPIHWPLLPHRLRHILRAAQAIRDEYQTRRMLNQLLDSIPVRVFWKDRELRYLGCNRRFAEDTGLQDPEQVVGLRDTALPWAAQADLFERDDQRVIQQDQAEYGQEHTRPRYDGQRLFVHCNRVPLKDSEGRPIGVLGTYEDITARREVEARIKFLAQRDSLTGLPNRALFNDRLRHAIDQAERGERLLGLLFLDLDQFKSVNDSLGHQFGDELLVQVSERLQHSVRASDTVARLGGDEFTVILETLHSTEQCKRVADKILLAFHDPFTLDDKPVYVTASIGIAIFPMAGRSGDSLLRNADTAMYRAKAAGRNRYRMYSSDMYADARQRLETENDLRRALEQDQFALWYQPQYALDGTRLIGFEALLRWRHPQRGLLLPEAFMPLLEDTGLIVSIGEWALHEACRQAAQWRDQGLEPARVAVNLSTRQFNEPDLLEKIRGALGDSGLEPQRLELEITETSLMQDYHAAAEVLSTLRGLGVRVALDDFGTGYSSMNYLKHFPLDALKIDRSFIKDLSEHGDSAAITDAIIALARSLQLRVIAEGVESREQLVQLRSLGSDAVQGHLLNPALPAERIAGVFAGTIGALPTADPD